MSEELTLETLRETVREWRLQFDTSKLPRVLHILGEDVFYRRVMEALRTNGVLPSRPERTTTLFPDTWYGIRIQRHKDHGETDAVCVEMANGEIMVLDLIGDEE